MKLHSPQFERGLKRKVRHAIRSSRELKREYRRVKRYRRQIRTEWLWRLVCSAGFGWLVWFVQTETGHLSTALAVGGIYLLALLCFRTGALWTTLYRSPDLAALTLLPVTEDKIFRWQMQKFLRSSLYALVDVAILFGTLAALNDFPLWKWGVAVFYVALTWLALMGMTIYCALKLPQKLISPLGLWIYVLAAILFFGRSVLWAPFIRWLDNYALVLNVALPTAWPFASFAMLDDGHGWWLLTLWLPVAAILVRSREWLAGLRAGLQYEEYVLPASVDLLPGHTEHARADGSASPPPLGPTEIEEIVASRSFLARPALPLRWVPEQVLWNWLTPRERVLAEFIHPNGLEITKAWKRLFVVLAATCLLGIVAGMLSALAQWIVLGMGALMVTSLLLMTFVSHGRAFSPMGSGGVNIPISASYGISYFELSRFFFKHAAVQLPFVMLTYLVLSGLAVWLFEWPPARTIEIALEAAVLTLAARCMLMVFAFSAGTNDTSRFKVSAILLVIAAAVFCVGFAGLAAMSLSFPLSPRSLVFLAGALLTAWLFVWSYGWFYRYGRFDLMAVPR